MSRTPGMTARAAAFAVHYVANGAKAKLAAIQAGYAPAGAANAATYLLRNPMVADLIAQKIRHQAPGSRETFAHVMRRGPAHLRARIQTYDLPSEFSASAILVGNAALPPETPN